MKNVILFGLAFAGMLVVCEAFPPPPPRHHWPKPPSTTTTTTTTTAKPGKGWGRDESHEHDRDDHRHHRPTSPPPRKQPCGAEIVRSKHGQCPRPDLRLARQCHTCKDACRHDFECEGRSICCAMPGCGNQCVRPEQHHH